MKLNHPRYRLAQLPFLVTVALCLALTPLRADEFDDHRKLVEQQLPGGYVHSRIKGQGGCSISPVKDRPGHFLFQGEGDSGKSIYRLVDDNAYQLVKVEGAAHPASATVVITKNSVEIFWRCAENDIWIRPR